MLEAITRTEKYLARLCGANAPVPEPLTRTDFFLAKLCGMEVDVPEPVTRGEMYMAKLCGMNVVVPEPVTRLEMYMAEACGMEVDVPEPVTRLEYYWNIYSDYHEYTGALPIVLASESGGALRDYRIYGDSVQDGTPTPEGPVEVVSVGDKTSNLFDLSPFYFNDATYAHSFNISGNAVQAFLNLLHNHIGNTLYYNCDVEGDDTEYRVAVGTCMIYQQSYRIVTLVPGQLTTMPSFNISDVTSIVFYGSHNGITTRIFNGMLCVSASAVEYEPYGKYKIPVTVSGENGEETTANIYLDEPLRKIGDYADYVDYDRQLLVRNIQKLIFTGDEKWAMQEINTLTTRFRVDIQHSISQSSGLCSHVPFVRSGVSHDEVLCGINNNTFYFRINKEIASNVIEFKDYLSSQAAKGTPVTLYYPRVTPITDPLDLPEIPTFAGTNVIDVDTTVKPSQMYVKYR